MRVGESAAILFLVLSSFAASVVAPTKSELEAMYAAAAQELNAGHYRDALQKLDAIDARQPDVAAAQNLRGVALMRLGEYRNAETVLREARVIDPGFWEARFNLAEVAFLSKDWSEARRRFTALLVEPNEHLEEATIDLIQFKILLTCLLAGKEKLVAPILEKLQGSVASPALYYAKAALALRNKDREEAKAWMATAAKEFSPQLNKLFAESFYEIGWLRKPEGATPVALEVASPAERIARAQADLAQAERAYRRGDLDGAWRLLDRVEATAPKQAVTYNLRGEILLDQGKIDEAETALRNALAADPQLLAARYNLARVPFARKDYDTARKELEALLGATAGSKEGPRERLMRYQIYLTLLLEGRDGAAQKAMDEFKMMDSSPALYYAQAAWAFQHGNPRQGKNWVANAGNLYSAELNRAFAAPFSDLGWLNGPASTSSATPVPSAVVAQNIPPKSEATPSIAAAPAEQQVTPPPPVEATPPPPAVRQTEAAMPAESPEPEISETPKKVGSLERERSKTRRSAGKDWRASAGRAAPPAVSKSLAAARSSPGLTPAQGNTPRENLGDKVRNLVLYPFRRPLVRPTPVPVGPLAVPGTTATPSPRPLPKI